LEKNGKLSRKVNIGIKNLFQDIKSIKNLSIPICSVHGDYDFFYNILFDTNGAKLLDFEHFETEGLPFLDLASLIFNPLLMNDNFLASGLDLSHFIKEQGVSDLLINWLNLYAQLSGISNETIKLFGKFAVLEQQTKNYPFYRDPTTFPLYNEKIFLDLLSYDFEL
jgi:hypothetical protein